jgi:hypothetical protein
VSSWGAAGVQKTEIACTPVKWYAMKNYCRARTIALLCTSLKLFESAKNKSGGLGVVGSNPAAPTKENQRLNSDFPNIDFRENKPG